MRDCSIFFFNDTATTEIYTLSLHDALPICSVRPHAADEAVVVLRRGAAVDVRDEIDVLRRVVQHRFRREESRDGGDLRGRRRRGSGRRWHRRDLDGRGGRPRSLGLGRGWAPWHWVAGPGHPQ